MKYCDAIKQQFEKAPQKKIVLSFNTYYQYKRTMSVLLKYFYSLRMTSQMNLLMIPILTLVIICFLLIQLQNISLTYSYFSQSTSIMYNTQNYRSINIRLKRVVRISRQLFNINANKVQAINLLYNKSFENIGSNQSEFNLEFNANMFSTYECPMFTYCSYGIINQSDAQDQQFLNFTSVLNTLIFSLDMTAMFTSKQIILIFNSSAAITATTPSAVTQLNQSPLERPWYLKHVQDYYINGGNHCYITDIFVKFSPLVYMQSVQHSLLYNGFRGLVGIKFNFTRMKTLLDISNDHILLIYENGTVLFQNVFIDYSELNQIINVYDQNITGFDQSQWDVLMTAASQAKYNNLITTYNTVLNKQMTIAIYKFTNLPYYLMLYKLYINNRFANLEEDENSKKLSGNILRSLHLEQAIGLCRIFFCNFFIFILLSISIYLIVKPIKRIKWHIENSQKINQTNTMFLPKTSNNQLLDLELNLIKLILRMRKSSMVKSNACSILENFIWPKQIDEIMRIQLDEIFDTNQIISFRMIISRIKQVAEQQSPRSYDIYEKAESTQEEINYQMIYAFFTKT